MYLMDRVKDDEGSNNKAHYNDIRDHHQVQLHMTDGTSLQDNSNETNLDIGMEVACFGFCRGLSLILTIKTS